MCRDDLLKENHCSGCGSPGVGNVVISNSSGIQTAAGQATDKEHGNALSNRAPIQCPTSSNPVNGEDADERGEHVEDVVQTRDPESFRWTETGDVEDGYSRFWLARGFPTVRTDRNGLMTYLGRTW